MNVKIALIFTFCILNFSGYAQIYLVNPSFEDSPSDATIPQGWHACAEGTTPDILPGFWGEYNDAAHGNTYMGIITRENSTYESVGQRLSTPLEKETCYKFSFKAAMGQVYSGYNNPIKIRIYLGKEKCDKGQLVYESELIKNEDWEMHIVEFATTDEFQYLIIEAFHKEGKFAYKGNVLLDQMSPIFNCKRV